MKKTKTQKGITLVALIITIIILLILAVVAINSIKGDGIIQYAKNARDQYEQAQANEQAMIDNYIAQIEGNISGGGTQITWTMTSEGDLAVGSTVKHIATEEEFYVIGGDTAGTPITSSTKKVLLLAKNNLTADGLAQGTGTVNECAFSSTNYWSSETSYPADLNDTEKYPIPEGETSIITIAKTYGASLGATGRLMTTEEVEALGGNSDDGFTTDCPDFINSTDYWLGSATNNICAGSCSGGYALSGHRFEWNDVLGIRPVVEILKSEIS